MIEGSRLSCALARTALCALLLWAPRLAAQPAAAEEHAPGESVVEARDPTRLDVQRLPPEAVEVTRDLYARGLFVEAQLGALAFAGSANRVSGAGPRVAIALGYEFTHWLSALVLAEGSLHRTDNRPPPRATAYELLGTAAGARLSLPMTARAALWATGLVGVNWTTRDVLRALGFRDAFKLGLNYGGEVGFDWHVRSRHHSLGLLGGIRALPNLAAKRQFTLSNYGSLYLRYVF
jgi:hypothetical protein